MKLLSILFPFSVDVVRGICMMVTSIKSYVAIALEISSFSLLVMLNHFMMRMTTK